MSSWLIWCLFFFPVHTNTDRHTERQQKWDRFEIRTVLRPACMSSSLYLMAHADPGLFPLLYNTACRALWYDLCVLCIYLCIYPLSCSHLLFNAVLCVEWRMKTFTHAQTRRDVKTAFIRLSECPCVLNLLFPSTGKSVPGKCSRAQWWIRFPCAQWPRGRIQILFCDPRAMKSVGLRRSSAHTGLIKSV